MKRLSAFAAFLLIFQLIPNSSQAATIKLTIRYSVPYSYEGDGGNYGLEASVTCLVDSACAAANVRKAKLALKAAATKKTFDLGCKNQDTSYIGSRLKVTSATGSTAGLGYLTSVSAMNIRYEISPANVPDWDEETMGDYPYESEEDDPDYIEDGYEYVFYTADCVYSGTVTLVKSNAYTIYVAGMRGPEYSYSELASKKWALTLVDDN